MTAADPLDAILAGPRPDGTDMRTVLTALHAHLPTVGDPATIDGMLALLRMLHRIARSDLPLARVFEGHVDALQIVARYGDGEVAAAAAANAAEGAIFGVWNAALPDEPLRIEDGRLSGGKAFASGAGVIDHALVGAATAAGQQLFLIDLARSSPDIDRDWWHVVGMQRSQTHVVRWNAAPPESFVAIGAVDDYAREPWFGGGALRFVAAHAGGVAGLFDHVRDHLRKAGRADDPHQAGRLAELFVAAELAAAAVRGAARAWFDGDDAGKVAHVAVARLAVAEQAERAITLAQQAVGVQGLFRRHPLAAALTDLTVYLRQPAPDAQRMRVGKAAADGVLKLRL